MVITYATIIATEIRRIIEMSILLLINLYIYLPSYFNDYSLQLYAKRPLAFDSADISLAIQSVNEYVTSICEQNPHDRRDI